MMYVYVHVHIYMWYSYTVHDVLAYIYMYTSNILLRYMYEFVLHVPVRIGAPTNLTFYSKILPVTYLVHVKRFTCVY